MSYHKIGPDAIESFKEDLEANLEYLEKNADDCSDPPFAMSLCAYYKKREYLSDSQLFRATQFWTEAKEVNGD